MIMHNSMTGTWWRPALASRKRARRVRTAGVLLVVGMLGWWAGVLAFMPALPDPYDALDISRRMWSIAGHRGAWLVQNILLFAGIVATAWGLSLLTEPLRRLGSPLAPRLGRWMILAGAAIWTFIIYFLLAIPAESVRTAADLPPIYTAIDGWIRQLASALTLGSFIAYGVALLGSRLPRWIGIATVLSSATMLICTLLMGKGLPPILFFLVTFVIGSALLRRGRLLLPVRRPRPVT